VNRRERIDRDFERYHRNGWAPVPWRQHPPELRRAIRAARMRPKLKGCFENSLRLTLEQREVPVTYVEGWCTSSLVGWPFQHAWVRIGDTEHDVTIVDGDVRRLVKWEPPRDYIVTAIIEREWFGPVAEPVFARTFRAALAMLGVDLPTAKEHTQ